MARARTARPHRLALAGALAALVVALQVQAPAQSAQTPLNLYGRGATGANGVVAAAKPEASRVGIEILKKGGNAVDAAVATGFALGVLEPNASGIGGGGFMIVKLANMKEAVVIDFRPTAPAAATPDMYKLDERGRRDRQRLGRGRAGVGGAGRGQGPPLRARHSTGRRSSPAPR